MPASDTKKLTTIPDLDISVPRKKLNDATD
jgi:hypothetical protein